MQNTLSMTIRHLQEIRAQSASAPPLIDRHAAGKAKRPYLWAGRLVSTLSSSACRQDFINQAVFHGCIGRHEIIPIGVLADLVNGPPGLVGQDSIQTLT